MATYKVIQDIEAEDKLLGPLTLRQFIYAIIAIASGAIIFKLATIKWYLALPLVPHTILFFVLAAPFGHDQPSEVWLLAKIRFFLKPRRRIWDQSGIKELVTITAPKKIEKQLTKNLSQTEVRSRLEALANTIDSRGWAIKNVNVNLFSQPSYVLAQADSDRLIDPTTIAQDVPNYDVQPVSDMLDEASNPTAQHFNQLMTQSQQVHRQQIVQQMQQGGATPPQTQPDYWFLSQTPQPKNVPAGYATFDHNLLVNPGVQQQASNSTVTSADEQALLEKIHEEQKKPKEGNSHIKKILPISEQTKHTKGHKKKTKDTPEASAAIKQPEAPLAKSDPMILELANNDDLNVATIARQAEKARKLTQGDDEVVIKLH